MQKAEFPVFPANILINQRNLSDSQHLVCAELPVPGHVMCTEHSMFTEYLVSIENLTFADYLVSKST